MSFENDILTRVEIFQSLTGKSSIVYRKREGFFVKSNEQ